MNDSPAPANGFRLHPEVTNDLNHIAAYIADNRSLDEAERVIEEIREAVRRLVPFPHQGHRRPDLTKQPLRFISVYDYLVAYAPDESPLWVLGVLHGRRRPRRLAAILRDRSNAPVA